VAEVRGTDGVGLSLVVVLLLLCAAGAFVAPADTQRALDEFSCVASQDATTRYTSHPRISIDGDADFVAQATSEGWPGDGSAEDPYIVGGYDIDGSGYRTAVAIGNTTVHFEVRECYIHDSVQAGAHLYNVLNGRVVDNSFVRNSPNAVRLSGSDNVSVEENLLSENTGTGIYLYDSELNEIVGNTIHNSASAMYVSYSNGNLILNNTVTGTGGGFTLGSSCDNTISGNNCSYRTGNGIVFMASAIYSTGNLISGNTLVHNTQTGLMLNNGGNRVIGNDCSNNMGSGIRMETSSGSNISENICNENNQHGILLSFPVGCRVNDNQCVGNGASGISLGMVPIRVDGEAKRNTCTFNAEHGITASGGSLDRFGHYAFDRNNCSGNGANGIYLMFANGNSITNNTCMDNSESGIVLMACIGNLLSDNDCSGNFACGVTLDRLVVPWDPSKTYPSSNNLLLENSLYRNGLFGLNISWGSDNQASGSQVYGNPQGFRLYACSYAEVDGNAFSDDLGYAVDIDTCLYTTLRANSMVNGGIVLQGGAPQYWALQDIDGSNTVNGRPVYYMSEGLGSVIPSGVGQVILADCRWMTVENQLLSQTSFGVQAGYCSNITIQYSVISDNVCGIELYESDYCTVYWNDVTSNRGYGALIHNGSHNLVWNNVFAFNNGAGTVYDPLHVQAVDYGSGNMWNSTDTGNWWSDWQSPDGNGDGIVDNPYAIDGPAGSMDYFPLTDMPDPIPEFAVPMLAMMMVVLLTALLSILRRGRR